jgi:hypothetical protein
MAGGPRIVRTGNPWLELPAGPPYVPPGDASAVEGFNARARPDYRLQLDLLPEPFLGSPDAPVVLLNLNPGFAEGDRAAHADIGFRNAVLRTLRHEPQPFPFHYLDPTGTSLGHRWWRQRLGRVLAHVPAEHVASRLLCIEYFPYHSRKFAHGTLRLRSQAYGFELARQAVVRAASVVLLRGERPWLEAVPELASHAKLFRLRTARTSRCRHVTVSAASSASLKPWPFMSNREPSNNEMQRTRPGWNGASPLNSVFGGPIKVD